MTPASHHLDWHRRIVEGSTLVVATTLCVTGLLPFMGWFVPSFTEGILPGGFVDFFRDQGWSTSATLAALHIVAGFLLVGLLAYGGIMWQRGVIDPSFTTGGPETATSSFLHWLGGILLIRGRSKRLHFRDMLMLPRLELAVAIGIAMATALLAILPIPGIQEMGLALHRINSLYFLSLLGYSGIVWALQRRGPCPYPTYVRDGHQIRRQPRFE